MLDAGRKRALQGRSLKDLVRLGEPKFTDAWFPYTSGEVGPYYIQSVTIEKDGEAYAKAVEGLCELITAVLGGDGFDVVSGGESRDWDFSNPAACLLKKPHAKLYKNGKTLGAEIEGRRLIHVADLNNEGSSVRDFWKPIIEGKGGTLVYAFFFIDRMEEGIKVLRDLAVPTESLVCLDDEAWESLLTMGAISRALYSSLKDRSLDRHAWARNALRERPDVLGDMLISADQDAVRRGKKILDTGYPDMKDELLSLLSAKGYTL